MTSEEVERRKAGKWKFRFQAVQRRQRLPCDKIPNHLICTSASQNEAHLSMNVFTRSCRESCHFEFLPSVTSLLGDNSRIQPVDMMTSTTA